MRIGFIGAGSMARALALGIGEPAVFSSGTGKRARVLAGEAGGTAVESNAELAGSVDVVFLCHKPKQLDEVAAAVVDSAQAIVSVLAATPLATLEARFPNRPVYRIMAGIPAEVGRGVITWTEGSRAAEGPAAELRELLGRCGTVVDVDESLVEPAMALTGCGPAFFADFAEALADAGERHGLSRPQALALVTETMAATAAYLAANELDAPSLRHRVATPGGVTEQGLRRLDQKGLSRAVDAAVDLVVEAARP